MAGKARQSAKTPAQACDVIVVGAGAGSMTPAVNLARYWRQLIERAIAIRKAIAERSSVDTASDNVALSFIMSDAPNL